MLTQEEIHEIETEIPHYAQKEAVCIDAMKIIQKHRGWVSDEALRDLGNFLNMSPDELDSIATFYNLIFREPVGRHVVLLCNSVSCWIKGSEHIQQHICEKLNVQLGQTTADGEFTVLPIVCLGACDHAPVMMMDNCLVEDLDEAKIDRSLAFPTEV